MDRLVDTVDLALAVRDTAQTSGGQQTQGARDDAGLITDDVSKQVARDNDTVQLTGVLDHEHGRGVDQMVSVLQLRELLLHDFGHSLAPQTARSQDVSLVQTPDRERRVVLQGQVSSETDDTLDLSAGVRFSVHSLTVTVVFFPVAEVDTTGQFTDDVEVDAAADVSLEGRDVDERGSSEVAWSQVAESAHLLAQLKDTLLGANSTSSPFLTSSAFGYFVTRSWG